MRLLIKGIQLSLVMMAGFIASGCASMGPTQLPPNREAYNRSLQESSNEQMLLNIVRLRYGDTPYFLNVDTISAAMEFTTTGNAGGSLGHLNRSADGLHPDPVNNYVENEGVGNVSASVTVSDKPTILYRPLQGSTFANQTLAPVDVQTILWLNESGWSLSRLICVIILRMGDLENAPEASRIVIENPPRFEDFKKFASLLQNLEESHAVTIVPLLVEKLGTHKVEGRNLQSFDRAISKDNEVVIRVMFNNNPRMKPLYLEWLRLLKINHYVDHVNFAPSTIEQIDDNTFGFETRSFFGILGFLSKGVDVPPEAIENHIAPVVYDHGTVFDWQQVLGNTFHVRCSKKYPKSAYLSVFHRGYWYYIDDSDQKSKQVFNLLQLIFSIQAGESKSAIGVAPVIAVN